MPLWLKAGNQLEIINNYGNELSRCRVSIACRSRSYHFPYLEKQDQGKTSIKASSIIFNGKIKMQSSCSKERSHKISYIDKLSWVILLILVAFLVFSGIRSCNLYTP